MPFHCRLCSLGVLFVRRIPGSQALPLLPSFHQHHVVPGSQFSPGYPGLLWLHLDQVPQGLLGHMSCMSTSRFVHHYYKMENIEQAAKKNRKFNDKMLLVLDNFVCNLAFQSRWGSAYWFSLIASAYFGCLRFSFLGLRFLIFECILSIS